MAGREWRQAARDRRNLKRLLSVWLYLNGLHLPLLEISTLKAQAIQVILVKKPEKLIPS